MQYIVKSLVECLMLQTIRFIEIDEIRTDHFSEIQVNIFTESSEGTVVNANG